MKKFKVYCLALSMLLLCTACGNSPLSKPATEAAASTTASSSSFQSAAAALSSVPKESSSQSVAAAPSSVPEEHSPENSGSITSVGTTSESSEPSKRQAEKPHILIAYYTRTGNTGQLASLIAEQTGGTLFEIESTAAYPSDYNAMLEVAQQEQRDNARPPLVADVESMSDYDTVFIGYPIWWGDVPRVVLTFLEGHDFAEKTIIPFCTYGSSGSGQSFNSVKAAVKGATLLDGFGTAGSGADGAEEEITRWIDGLVILK